MQSLRNAGYLATALLLAQTPLVAAKAACERLALEAKQDFASGNLRRLRGLFEAASADIGCSAHQRAEIGRLTALSHLSALAGLSDREAEALLTGALSYGRPWQVLAELGVMRHDARDYRAAVRLFDEALATLDGSRTLQGDAARQIARLARQSRLAASAAEPYESLRYPRRDGGVAAFWEPGCFGPEPIPLPIAFAAGSGAMTGGGSAAADDLAAALRTEGNPPIRLTGHADTGEGADGERLGLLRADALRDLLTARGYTGTIEIASAGSTEPLRLLNPEAYDEDTTRRMNRRVDVAPIPSPEPSRACPR